GGSVSVTRRPCSYRVLPCPIVGTSPCVGVYGCISSVPVSSSVTGPSPSGAVPPPVAATESDSGAPAARDETRARRRARTITPGTDLAGDEVADHQERVHQRGSSGPFADRPAAGIGGSVGGSGRDLGCGDGAVGCMRCQAHG